MVSDQVSEMIGSAVKRKEDPRLITGQGGYTADVRLEGMTYMAVARSPYAHAPIRRIDPAGALRHPEVLAMLTGRDVNQRCKTHLRLYDVKEQMKIKAAWPVATIVSAVVDALASLGVTHMDMPVTPEKVWRAPRRIALRLIAPNRALACRRWTRPA